MAVPDDFHHNADGTALNDIEGRPLPAQEHPPVVRDVGSRDDKEAIHRAGSPEEASELKSHEEAMPSEAAQNGVKKIEAVTLAWSKKSLAGVLILYVSPCYVCLRDDIADMLFPQYLASYLGQQFQGHHCRQLDALCHE